MVEVVVDRGMGGGKLLDRDNPDFANSAVDFMKERLLRQRFQRRILVRPQYQQICTTDRKIALDYVGRYEHLQESYDTICEQIGIPTTELGRKNSSNHSSYNELYDDDLRELVGNFY